jgi:hypothetical protein
MKIRITILSLLLATIGFCDWPAKTVSASAISSDPVETLAPYLEEAREIYLTASDYRGITLKFNGKTGKWDCSVPVAYYEVSHWLAGGWKDSEKIGWSRRPSNGLENIHSDLGSLVGILDQASIEIRRVSTVRTDHESKNLRAIWNKLEFSIAKDRVAIIYPLMRDLFSDYQPDTEVHIYTEDKEAEQPAADPASTPKGNGKPQPGKAVEPR